jgi:hypothetical protein
VHLPCGRSVAQQASLHDAGRWLGRRSMKCGEHSPLGPAGAGENVPWRGMGHNMRRDTLKSQPGSHVRTWVPQTLNPKP